MNFALTEDQLMIRDAAESFLAEASASAAVRAAMERETGFDPALWARIGQEMGWCATRIAEIHGGLGLGVIELALLLEQMGRRLTCAPFFPTVCLAATVLEEVGSEAAQALWLPRIAAGSLCATLALTPQGIGWDPNMIGATASRGSRGWQLDGRFAHVPDGASADLILVVARIAEAQGGCEGIGLFAVPADAIGLERLQLTTWDATRRLATLRLEGVLLAEAARIDDPARTRDGLERTQALGALLLAAEQIGGAQQCLDLTLAYTAERVQFGRTIASFQAVKHRCAEMMVRVEAARSAVYGAAALASGSPTTQQLSMEAGAAKAQASDAFYFCAQEAMQLHGGVGFTWEYDPHLYFKRAQASSRWLGTAEQWRERIACALLD
jgi:alkylation response protein AidB-like acyl-CoA dehydrogenase